MEEIQRQMKKKINKKTICQIRKVAYSDERHKGCGFKMNNQCNVMQHMKRMYYKREQLRKEIIEIRNY